jgi:phosphatidylserine/phosphatidylglycerophosphate/cardiolipin synthase-like enzyme
MRAETRNTQVQVKAVSGTHVVLLAIKPEASAFADLRGFAISRAVGDEPPVFLRGIKFFDGTAPNWKKGDTFSSHDQPIQSLFWSDYAASPGAKYRFTITPRLGAPGNLRDGDAIEIAIQTEPENDGKHGVWFNRGVVASHKFATKFHNRRLTEAMANDVKDGVLQDEEARWLSRGLAEAVLAFINGTKAGEGLRVCAYEFTWEPIIEALLAALERGVDVKVVYHAVDDNQKAIDGVGFPAKAHGQQILFERTRPPIPHNKFIVKLVGEKPRQVWTGSTNFTNTGFLGQTNVGHLVTDDDAAKTYLAYWTALSGNPTAANALAGSTKLTPNPPNAISKNSIAAFYSPRVADNMLDWYGQRIKDACSMTMITLPFNVAPSILKALDTAARPLRLAILETEPTKEVHDAEFRNKGKLAFSNGGILGKTFVHNPRGGAKVAPIPQGHLDEWFIEEELARPTNKGHVSFLHSKILLIDPLSDDPLICTGSANFSSNSLTSNDENMLLIRGETRVADIYLTELDRVFKHFYDRDAINRIAAHGDKPEGLHLDTSPDWINRNFTNGSYKHNRLTTFFPDGASDCGWSANALRGPDPFADEKKRADDKRRGRNEAARKRRAAGGARTSAGKNRTSAGKKKDKGSKRAAGKRTPKAALTKSSPRKRTAKKKTVKRK